MKIDNTTQNANFMPKYHQIELEQLFQTLQSSLATRVQLGVFFTTVTLVAMSIALTSQKSGLAIFSGVFMWVYIFIDMVFRGVMVLGYFRIEELRAKYALDNPYYMDYWVPEELIQKVHALSSNSEKMRAINRYILKPQTASAFWIPFGFSLFLIAFGILMWIFNSWTWF